MIGTLERKLDNVKATLTRIGDIRPIWTEKILKNGILGRTVDSIVVNDKPYRVTSRFMQSLAARFHIGREFFRYFTPDEVFQRVQEVHPRTHVRLTTDGQLALGLSNPAKPMIRPPELCRLLKSQGDRAIDVRYRQGIVTSTHRLDEANWSVGRDVFSQTYTMETPVDGFGLPSVYLSLIRLICTNGMVGYSPAFRTDIALGKNEFDGAEGPLGRAMECFSNEEGYSALRERLESARKSEASVYEVRMLSRAITRDCQPARRADLQQLFDRLWRLTGDLAVKYGVASEEAISRKKQSMLPMDCTVYDLLTFATEITSHHSDKLMDGRQVQGWVGQTLSTEFDLEGSLAADGRYEEYHSPAFYLN